MRQELKAGTWRKELTKDHLFRRGIAHSGLDSFTSIISPKTNAPQTVPTGQSNAGDSSAHLLFPSWLVSVWSTKTNQRIHGQSFMAMEMAERHGKGVL